MLIKPIKFVKPDYDLAELGIHAADWRLPYDDIINDINMEFQKNEDVAYEIMRQVAEMDFFFFCYAVMKLYYLNHPFAIARCYEYGDRLFENSILLWARAHYKSTIVTQTGSLYKEIKDHGRRQAIFSLNATLAKKHLLTIKFNCETNPLLHRLWSEIFWDDPRKLARTEGIIWTQDGINFKTATSAKDLSISGFGLIDSMPTGGHFTDKYYDDIIDLNNIGTYTMKEKVLYSINMSDNLGDPQNGTVDAFIGTRYDADDPYEKIIETYGYPVFTYPAEVDEDGKFILGGRPVLLTREVLDDKLKKQGIYIYSAQNGQAPINFKNKGFDPEAFRTIDKVPDGLNYIIIVDTAKRPHRRKMEKEQDYTVMKVYGFGKGMQNYVVDIVRDRLTLPEKWNALKTLHKLYKPYDVYYEQIGAQTDVEYFELKMEEEAYVFRIQEIYDNKVPKDKRIEMLASLYDERKIAYLKEIWYKTTDRGVVNLTHEFYEEEYSKYPRVRHDDGLDVDAWLLNDKIRKLYPNMGDDIDTNGVTTTSKYQVSPLDDEDYTGEGWYEW